VKWPSQRRDNKKRNMPEPSDHPKSKPIRRNPASNCNTTTCKPAFPSLDGKEKKPKELTVEELQSWNLLGEFRNLLADAPPSAASQPLR